MTSATRLGEPTPDSSPVVVGVDGSAGSDRAVRWAAATAAARSRRLLLVHAVALADARMLYTGCDRPVPSLLAELRARADRHLAAATTLARRVAPGLSIDTETAEGGPGLILLARSVAAHLLVLGATGAGGGSTQLGSTLLQLVSHGDGSIVVVRDAAFDRRVDTDGPVVVGVDGGPSGDVALGVAFAEASERGADLVVLHCWTDLSYGDFGSEGDTIEDRDIEAAARALVTDRMTGWREKYPEVPVTLEVRLSGPRHHLLMRSVSARLLVIGNRGRGGFAGLRLGSTAHALVQRAHCPVLLARLD